MRWVCAVVALAGCDRVFLGKEPTDAPSVIDVSNLPFGQPIALVNLNTAAEEDRATLTDDLLHLVFHRGDMLMASSRARVDVDFDPPTTITELIGGDATRRACLSGDGKQLYFSRSAGGDFDIYVTTRTDVAATWDPGTKLVEIAAQLLDGDEFCGWEDAARTSMIISTTFYGDRELLRIDRATPAAPFTELTRLTDFNTTDQEGAAWANEDGVIVVFDRAKTGESKLLQGTLQGSRYAVRVLSELELTGRVGSPWLSKDGRTIVFTHENDLYMATR